MNRAVVLVVALAALAGCPNRNPTPNISSLTPAQALARLTKEADRRARLSTVVKARMEGIQGLFANATLDVAVETPARMHLSVRSFFEQPMQVFATDGVTLTILDAAHPEGPRAFQGPVNGRALQSIFPVEVWPHEVVALFLQAAPAAGATPNQIAVDDRAGTYELGLLEPNEKISVVTARLSDDALVRWRRFTPAGELMFDARFEEHTTLAGIPFAARVRLAVPKGDDEEARVVFDLEEPILNGPALDDALFRLVLPEGLPIFPL